MTILIVYATVEGQTGKIAQVIRDRVVELGHEVRMLDAKRHKADVPLDEVQKVILAASVHERRHPKGFELYLSANRSRLRKLDTLLISVSLSAAFPEGLEEAQEYLTEMEMRTNFVPARELLVAGAVRMKEYDYYAAQVVRHVLMRGKEYDTEADVHEFTDWDALRAAVDDFVAEPAPA